MNANISLLMKQNQERVNEINYKGRALGCDNNSSCGEDSYYVNDQMGVFGLTLEDPIRIIDTKVKKSSSEHNTDENYNHDNNANSYRY